MDNEKIGNLIYEIRGKQVMLVSEIFVTKCHGNRVNMIIHYAIGLPIAVYYNFCRRVCKN